MSDTLSETYKKFSQQLDKAVTDQLGGAWSSDPAENDRLWRIEARKLLASLKDGGNSGAKQLFDELSSAPESEQLVAFGYFVWCMAEFGDTERALRGACDDASLPTPPAKSAEKDTVDPPNKRSRGGKHTGRGLRKTGIASAATLFAITSVAVGLNAVGTNQAATAAPANQQVNAKAKSTGTPSVDLSVKRGALISPEALCTDDRLDPNTLLSFNKSGRYRVDSMSTGYTSTTKEGMLQQQMTATCTNPTVGDGLAQAFAAAPKIGDFSIYKANEWWLKPFMQQSARSGMNSWLTYKNDRNGKTIVDAAGQPVLFVSPAYRQYASMINQLLLELDNQGVWSGIRSVANWPAGTLDSGNLPRAYDATDPEHQEGLPFLALVYTTKAKTACPFVLGLNTLDKRPEFFDCPTARVIAPETVVTQPRQQQRERAASPAAPAPAGVTPSRNVTPQAPVAPKPSSTTPPTTTTTVTTTPPTTPTTVTTTPPANPSTPPPETCTWKNGSVHELNHGLCPKDLSESPTSATGHDPVVVTGGPSAPTHPTQTADPATTPGSASTQEAPGATAAPQPSASVPAAEVSNGPTSPGTGSIDPNTGKPYTP